MPVTADRVLQLCQRAQRFRPARELCRWPTTSTRSRGSTRWRACPPARRCWCAAMSTPSRGRGRRGRHPPAVDGRHAGVRPRSGAGSRSSSATSAASRKTSRSARSTRSPSGWAKSSAAKCRSSTDWLDEATGTVKPHVSRARSRPPRRAACIVLENARDYDIERVLWKAKEADLPAIAPKLAKLANALAEKVAKRLRQRSPLGRQPRCVEHDRAAGDGPRGARQVRRRRVRTARCRSA